MIHQGQRAQEDQKILGTHVPRIAQGIQETLKTLKSKLQPSKTRWRCQSQMLIRDFLQVIYVITNRNLVQVVTLTLKELLLQNQEYRPLGIAQPMSLQIQSRRKKRVK